MQTPSKLTLETARPLQIGGWMGVPTRLSTPPLCKAWCRLPTTAAMGSPRSACPGGQQRPVEGPSSLLPRPSYRTLQAQGTVTSR